jgi:hypothetical protein
MSQFSYTKLPEWNNNGAMPNHVSTNVYAAPSGWEAPIGGSRIRTITAMAWSGGVVTCTSANHGLTVKGECLIVGVVPAGYNGYLPSLAVIDANTFSYPLASNPGTVTTQGTCQMAEVIVAINNLQNKILANSDAIAVPTFTAAATYSALAHAVTGDVLTVTLTASEPVTVSGTPFINVTIGANTRRFSYTSVGSTSTSLKFTYTVVAGDVAIGGGVVSAASATLTNVNAGIGDILAATNAVRWMGTVTFTAPVMTTISVN